jgi:maltooligosyltrehalose trehalohydrolase
VLKSGYLYIGQHSSYRGRKYGLRPNTRDGAKFVISSQNHDQVGNRMMGDRLTNLVSLDQVRQAAAAIILAPFIPMLFMGEEYGEKAPFQYFTSHSDADLIEAVRKGRAEEFDDFAWSGEPPDPHDVETFNRSRLNWESLRRAEHQSMLRLYKQLLAFRRDVPSLRSLDLDAVETLADDDRRVLLIVRAAGGHRSLLAFNFSDKARRVTMTFTPAKWQSLIDTGATIDGNEVTLAPHSFALWSAGS